MQKEDELLTLKQQESLDFKAILELTDQIECLRLGVANMLDLRKELFPGNRVSQ